jgi:serine phosphatase RsbU (regulator of sigma subunit)
MNRFHLTLIFLTITSQLFPQEPGMPFIRNYTPAEYGASQQNWAIAQDKRGIMYFGNNDGLLEFDGINWKLIKLPLVRSISIDSAGRIFVGLENDIGYLQPDNIGNYKYYSLKEKIPEIYRDLSPVFSTLTLTDRVIFYTAEKLLLYQHGQIKIIRSENSFRGPFIVNDRLFIPEQEKGLFYMAGDSLIFIKGSEFLASARISAMLPFGQNEVLIATRNRGVYIYSPESRPAFHKSDKLSEVDNFFLKNPAYSGIVLPNSDYAIGTIIGGILVFDAEGKIKNLYNKSYGLQDNTIFSLYSDQNHQLWAGTDNGISLIQNDLPFRNYTYQNGLNGSPNCLYIFNDRLYTGTSQYLHILDQEGNFEIIAGYKGQTFRLYDADGTLLLAGNPGIYNIKGNQAIPLENSSEYFALTFCPFKNHPGYLLAGGEGLYLLQNENSTWKLKQRLKGFNRDVYEIVEDSEENIWISTIVSLYKLRINDSADSVTFWEQLTVKEGLPSNYGYPFRLNSGEIVFGTEKGIYRYLNDKEKFEPHPDFRMFTGKVFPFVQLKNGDIWFDELLDNGNHEKGVLKLINGKYIQYRTPFYKFTKIGCNDSQANICSSPDGKVFIGTTTGLLQYDPSVKLNFDQPFNTLIRKVFSRDSLLFGGIKSDNSDFDKIGGKEIQYLQNDLTFHFAATFYEDSERNLYSYRLIGSDTAWSAWVGDHKKEYTNLYEGNYTFEVKSKNQYQKTGSASSYSFSVLPPWYRTWWTYGSYVVLAVLFIWLIVRINIRRLVKKKEELEEIVTERTAEVNLQKKEIQEKNEVLNQTNIELKSTLVIVNSQKKQIETVHEEITASINYAKYIQSSILPKADQLELFLDEHFILYKPKEIVSGDFYWVSKIGNKTIIVAADCTGHGVPGAFMSMLGITLLNEIVSKESNTNPAVILDRLRNEVTASLKQKGDRWEQKDGMDLALCTIDLENMKLQFAGAINPLYLIRTPALENVGITHTGIDSDLNLIEIKGDPMPIGIADEMVSFKYHEIDIKKGDSFYLFTDGFPDQFGGPSHKKFSHKQFREQLIKTKTKFLPDQKLMLEKVLYEWMGTSSQTDDILVIGFRIN